MLLSSNIIKQVDYELESCPVCPKLGRASSQEPAFLDAIKIEAQTILSNAKAQAESMLKQAADQIALTQKEACETGYKEGYEAGYKDAFQQGQEDIKQIREKAEADFNELIQQVLDQYNHLKEIHSTIYQEAEAELMNLSVNIAEKLVCCQLNINGDTIINIVKAACDQVRDCKEIILHVPVEQLEIIKSRHNEIQERLYRIEHLAISPDPDLKPGECFIETEQGYIDARSATMAEQLKIIIKGDVPCP